MFPAVMTAARHISPASSRHSALLADTTNEHCYFRTFRLLIHRLGMLLQWTSRAFASCISVFEKHKIRTSLSQKKLYSCCGIEWMYLQMFDEVVLRFSFPANNVSIEPRPLQVTSMMADSANCEPAIVSLPSMNSWRLLQTLFLGELCCSLHCFSFIHLMFN